MRRQKPTPGQSSPPTSLELAFFKNLISLSSSCEYRFLLLLFFFCLFCGGSFFSLSYWISPTFTSLVFQITHYSWSLTFYSFYSNYIFLSYCCCSEDRAAPLPCLHLLGRLPELYCCGGRLPCSHTAGGLSLTVAPPPNLA